MTDDRQKDEHEEAPNGAISGIEMTGMLRALHQAPLAAAAEPGHPSPRIILVPAVK